MIIRKVDNLGRITLPREMRRELGINIQDPVEMKVEGRQIVVNKHEERCAFCGDDTELIVFKEKKVCKNCLEELNKESF